MIFILLSFLLFIVQINAHSLPVETDTTLEHLPKRLVEEAIPIYDDDLTGIPRNSQRGRRRRMRTNPREPYKRPSFHPWAGKRSEELDMDVSKRRFGPWGGKRSDDLPEYIPSTEGLKQFLDIFIKELRLNAKLKQDLTNKATVLADIFHKDDGTLSKELTDSNLIGSEDLAKHLNDNDIESEIEPRERRQFSAWGGRYVDELIPYLFNEFIMFLTWA
ncbi:hypothetical protein FSP39_008514 [Pinctada imbricata]|uniref:Uncharacterized protein n=1 Tax=Pinctada imbricata TaxID=66713 RepID=A0AA88YQ48_PINIB|nr:hypothetical protein FSP39_008514 [Pinctada imbricata]